MVWHHHPIAHNRYNPFLMDWSTPAYLSLHTRCRVASGGYPILLPGDRDRLRNVLFPIRLPAMAAWAAAQNAVPVLPADWSAVLALLPAGCAVRHSAVRLFLVPGKLLPPVVGLVHTPH